MLLNRRAFTTQQNFSLFVIIFGLDACKFVACSILLILACTVHLGSKSATYPWEKKEINYMFFGMYTVHNILSLTSEVCN